MELCSAESREALPSDPDTWLPQLMRRLGPAGRTLWLMHESPVGLPLAHPCTFNPAWTGAVERFAPRLVACGHDHSTPLKNGTWHTPLGKSTCLNVGQAETALHFAVLDFEFDRVAPSQPLKVLVRAFPWGEEISL